MFVGVIIAESLAAGSAIDDVPLVVRRISRAAPGDVSPDQPPVWTLIEFDVDERYADTLAGVLSDVLAEPGWYADLRSDEETIVVFPGRVFRYPRGDDHGRARAMAHGRTLGIPDSQLDWPE